MFPTPKPFTVHISNAEQELLTKKLQLVRLPEGDSQSTWGEDNGITLGFMQETIRYWLEEYDWESEQRKINELPQFKANIELKEWGNFNVHFVHSRCNEEEGIPLLFLHGWPGNFTEVTKILQPLLSAGFHVIAPSLPGFGFSSYADKEGFKNWHSAELMHRLMTGLGYGRYVVAGGDWGAIIGTSMVRLYPDNIKAIHLTNVFVNPPEDKDNLEYSGFELRSLERMGWFAESQADYGQIQKSKPRTIGFAMWVTPGYEVNLHDSPLGILAWMADKLLLWSDEYPWTKDEIITWTLLHYFPGPTTAFQMYRENLPVFSRGELPPGVTETYVRVPTGVSAFAKEVFMVPRSWAEKDFNIVEWKQQPRGGHFPAHEQPQELCSDLVRFLRGHWTH